MTAAVRDGMVVRVARRHAIATAVVVLAALPATLVFAPSAVQAADCKAMAAPSIDWQGCRKVSLLISGSDLSGASLIETDLSATDLSGSNLAGANLEKATLIRSLLEGSTADKANFARIEGYRTIFTGVSATGSSFVSSELQRADFTGANLTGADFRKAELGRANFKDATITGTQFGMSNLSRAELQAAKFEGPIDFAGAFLFLTRLDGLDLSQATGLEQWQVDQACGDQATKLPAGLTPGAGWPCDFKFD
jgi:uncharacterized protein YjbI with pentapeptide repeats